MWDFLKQKTIEFFRDIPRMYEDKPSVIWFREMKESLPYLTPDLIAESTRGAFKGFAQGVIKGITLNNVELEALKPKTEVEAEAAKIPGMIGEIESWLVPFGIASKGIAMAMKASTKVPKVIKLMEKVPIVPRLIKAALPFAVVESFHKTEEQKEITEKFAEGALWGLGFGIIGGLVPLPPSLSKAAKSALENLGKKPQVIEIAKLPKTEQAILSRFGIGGENISKETYEKAMRASFRLSKTSPPPPKPPSTKLPLYPIEPYKRKLLQEINQMPSLPKIERNVLEWTPPTWSYKNPYTQRMYGAWNKINEWWVEKAPSWAKTFRNTKLEELAKERQRVIDGLTMKYTEAFITPIHKLSAAEKDAIGKMIYKYIPITPEYKPLIKQIDLHIGQLGKAIVDIDKRLMTEGVLKPEYALLTEETWFKHLGEYMRTVYLRPPIAPGKPIRVIPRRVFTADGVLDRSAFKRKLTDAEWGANSLLFEGKTILEITGYSMKELKKIGKEAKKRWGWVTEADYALARTFYDMSNVYATRLWQEAVFRTPELFSKTPKPGFIPITRFLAPGVKSDIRLGTLNDGFINPILEDEIRLFVASAKPTMQIFGEPLSWWKAFKVAGNPATVVRNYISGGLIQTDFAGYPVWGTKNSPIYIQAVRSYTTKDAFYKKLRDAGAYGADYYKIEIEPSIMKSIEKTMRTAQNPYLEYGSRMTDALGTKLKDIKQIFAYYGHIDHIQRTYLIRCALRDGATLPQAIHFANKWELNYRFVPKIVDQLRTGLPGYAFPFISFYALMAPRIAEVLITRPWTLMKYPILIGAANEFSRNILGMTKEQVEVAKPSFLTEQPYTMLLPYKDKVGNPVFLNLGYTLPFGSWESGFMDWRALLDIAKGGGLAGILHNLTTNYDSFTGRKIYEEGDMPSIKYEKIAEYTLKALSPGAVGHAINLIKAAQGEIVGFPYPKRRDFTQTTLRAIGISTYSGGYNDAWWKIKLLKNEIRKASFALTRLEKNPLISPEIKRELREETQEYIRKKTEEIRKIREVMPAAPLPYVPTIKGIPVLIPEQQRSLMTFPE